MNIKYAITTFEESDRLIQQYHWNRINRTFYVGELGDGINKLDIPRLYKTYIKESLEFSNDFQKYTESKGSDFLQGILSYYEKVIAYENTDTREGFCNCLSVTAGATAAIFFMFAYFREKYPVHKVYMLGLNYFLFEENCKLNHIEYEYIVSKKHGRILPSVEEIRIRLANINQRIIVLTIPANPSGEIYSYEEVAEICRICVAHNLILVVDKCQMEILTDCFTFVNVGKAVIEANAEDNVIFIDSFSKTRSIPGIRIGYIFSNNEELHQYINSYSNIIYCCPPTIIDGAIALDILARIKLYIRFDHKVITQYRNLIIMYYGYQAYKKMYGELFKDKDRLNDILDDFTNEIQENYQIILKNYQRTKEILLAIPNCRVTDLEGGFNFFLFIPDVNGLGEKDFFTKITESVDIKILSQSFFGAGNEYEALDGYWCRISVAISSKLLEERLETLKRAIIQIN